MYLTIVGTLFDTCPFQKWFRQSRGKIQLKYCHFYGKIQKDVNRKVNWITNQVLMHRRSHLISSARNLSVFETNSTGLSISCSCSTIICSISIDFNHEWCCAIWKKKYEILFIKHCIIHQQFLFKHSYLITQPHFAGEKLYTRSRYFRYQLRLWTLVKKSTCGKMDSIKAPVLDSAFIMSKKAFTKWCIYKWLIYWMKLKWVELGNLENLMKLQKSSKIWQVKDSF